MALIIAFTYYDPDLNPPRWSLLFLGTTSTYALLCIFIAYFRVPGILLNTFLILFLVSLYIFLGSISIIPTFTDGDPPGFMLSSFSIQSEDHFIITSVPIPKDLTSQVRIRIKLAKWYEGASHLTLGINTLENVTMQVPADGNLMYREFSFDSSVLSLSEISCNVHISVDRYDRNMRLSYWRSSAGRVDHSDTLYKTRYGSFIGVPEPLTGEFVRGWPFLWIENL